MTTEQMPPQGGGEGPAAARLQADKHQQLLAAQFERLDQLRQGLDDLRELRDRECELEVELIAAEAAHTAPLPSAQSGLDPGKAGLVAEALGRTGRLREDIRDLLNQNSPVVRPGARELARLKGAEDALNAWLDAPGTVKRRELAPVTQGLLGLALLACIWAGFTYNLMFLVLLVPLGLPFSFMAMGDHDLSWVRLGARRRFEASHLDPPAEWKTAAVEARRAEIQGSIRLASQQPPRESGPPETDERDAELKETQLFEAETQLQILMAEAGLDADRMSADLVEWLKLEGEVRAARRELAALKAKARRVGAATDAGREEVFRFLSRQGEAPPAGRADLDTLAAGLERVRHNLSAADNH